MPSAESRILVIANRTASTPVMLDVIAERPAAARASRCCPPEHGHTTTGPGGRAGAGRERRGRRGGELDRGRSPRHGASRRLRRRVRRADRLHRADAPRPLGASRPAPASSTSGCPCRDPTQDPDVPLSSSRSRRNAGRHGHHADRRRRSVLAADPASLTTVRRDDDGPPVHAARAALRARLARRRRALPGDPPFGPRPPTARRCRWTADGIPVRHVPGLPRRRLGASRCFGGPKDYGISLSTPRSAPTAGSRTLALNTGSA